MSSKLTKRVKNKELPQYSEDEVEEKRQKVQCKNTCNADKSTNSQFQQYLKKINEDIEFWNLTSNELDAHLSNY